MLNIAKQCGLEFTAADISKVFAFEKKLAKSYLAMSPILDFCDFASFGSLDM